MALKLIRSTEPITVAHPKLMIYGPSGIGKSTLKNMTRGLLSQDFDEGDHRVENRQDGIRPSEWGDVEELLENKELLSGYQTLGTDTIGRCLDLLAFDIIQRNPKLGNFGALSQQGWGQLRTRFKAYKERLDRSGKDIVWIAHEKEDKDGDVRIVRPDIQGSSYGLTLQSADLIGYLHMEGKERVLSFEPTERWIGKGPTGWGRVVVPDFKKAPYFLTDLLDKARTELGRVSQESADVAGKVADWEAAVEFISTPEELTEMVPKLKGLEPQMLLVQVREIVARKVKASGWAWDKDKAAYIVPEKVSA